MALVGAEIGADDGRIPLHLGRRPLGDLAPVVEHDDMVGDLHHHAHVVLDQQYADAVDVANRDQQVIELGRFARIEPGRRLVEAEQPRPGAHGPRDLKTPLGTVGQLAGRPVGIGHEMDALQPAARDTDGRRLGIAEALQAEQAEHAHARGKHQLVVLGDHQVLQHRHARKQANVLERPRHFGLLADLVAQHALQQVLAIGPQGQPSHGRLVEAGDAIKDRRLARAVGTDDRGYLARPGGEGDIVDRNEAAEPHREVLDCDQRRAVHATPRR
jgi:hypothetical protein